MEILLEEDGAHIYKDIMDEPFESRLFTVLPMGGVASPIDLVFMPINMGDVVQGYLSWKNPAADVRHNAINILENGKTIQSIPGLGERVDIESLPRGTYRVEVRAVNAAGDYFIDHNTGFSIEAPALPVNVDISVGMFSLTAAPRLGDSAAYDSTFEFLFSEKRLADISENAVINYATKVGKGQFWIQ
ncbi:MAG: hypothetical protein ACL7BU_05780 [Candidatus Phlomobacter fragariae]